MSVILIGYDADGDKVWMDEETKQVTMNGTQQGAEWTFECRGGRTLESYVRTFGPISEEK